jgi:hypothetical protein
MNTLPDRAGPDEATRIWHVREFILDTGQGAALQLEEWQQALEFTSEMQKSMRERGALVLQTAGVAFNNYGPLLRLRRYNEAGELLRACRDVFERENSIEMLGKVFSALADLEDELGRPVAARQFQKAALRYAYADGNPVDAAANHFNISIYMMNSQAPRREVLAHRLAAVLMVAAIRSGQAGPYFSRLARDLRDRGSESGGELPADFDALCATVEKVEGARFREMIERLAGGNAKCDQLFEEVVAGAVEAANKSE